MQVIGSALSDNVDDAAESAAIFSTETIVDHTKFADRFLGGRRALGTCAFIDVVGAIDSYGIAQVAHAAERNTGGFGFGESGLQAGPAGGNSGREQGEINEAAPIGRQLLDLCRV